LSDSADPDIICLAGQIMDRITSGRLLGDARVYGRGLRKLEPKELTNMSVPEKAEILAIDAQLSQQAEPFQAVATE
jgi:hypothetical protein